MNTRHAPPGSPLRQERFASSYDRGILANLVVKRGNVMESPELRALAWFYQWLSGQPGGLEMAERTCPDGFWKYKAGSFRGAIEDFCLNPHSFVSCYEKPLADFRQQWILRQPNIVETVVSRGVKPPSTKAKHRRQR